MGDSIEQLRKYCKDKFLTPQQLADALTGVLASMTSQVFVVEARTCKQWLCGQRHPRRLYLLAIDKLLASS